MLRRTVLYLLPAALAGSLAAQESTPDRLSGTVRTVDKKNMVIEITPRNSSAVRKVHYDAKTKFMLSDKASSIDEVAEGMRLVAIGKFAGVDLNATNITVRPR